MNQSPFAVRGVVEGFYGVYYTTPEREDLIKFLGELGYNLYVYAPKNDRQHRMRWREPYPTSVIAEFAQTVRMAEAAGVTFCYALSPGPTVCYAAVEDFQHITDKLTAFYDLGVRAFSLLLDDIDSGFSHEADRKQYATFAAAHADICNRLYAWLQALDSACTLSMCPTDYAGTPPFSDYLHELGAKLQPAVDIFYTGSDVCSRVIDTKTTAQFAQAARRKPIIWDNYPVNDGGMAPDMHMGPILGREATLPEAAKGFIVNPMNQAEASKVALFTFADYFADPPGYQSETSWRRALRAVAGAESVEPLRLFAENSLRSCLQKTAAPYLESLVTNLMTELENGKRPSQSPAAATLTQYIDDLGEATYHLKFRMENLALRNNLLPWIEALEHWFWAGRRALALLECDRDRERARRQIEESFQAAQSHHKTSGGAALRPLIKYALN